MKKYLMTGIAAVAMCAAFTSCSKELSSLSPEEQENLVAQQMFSKYENAFIAVFGQPAPDQEWGFGTLNSNARAMTRVENANANEWADPSKAYGGLLVPPPLTDEQIAVVKKYFQTVPNIKYEDPHWTNYFIQQVYKGGDDVGPYSPEEYLAANNSTRIVGSNNMDHLAAINGDFVDHINNFNHGDCSKNHDVLDNGYTVNNPKSHKDKIMYMKESTTASFGYYNSNGSVRRTEYTGLVSFQTIIDKLGPEAYCLDDGWNRSFMGFDFEQMIGPEIIEGTFEFEGKTYNRLKANTNMYCCDRSEKTYSTIGGVANFGDEPDAATKRQLLAKGYLPTSTTFKDWVKVGGCADGYYSDWIVTLTEAKTNIPYPEATSLRVMAEDLSASERSDFDFNDVVFDVVRVDDGHAKIILQAAGGTLPLRINSNNGVGGWEVHKAYNVAVNVMVNTNASAKGLTGEDNLGYKELGTVEGDFSAAKFCETVRNIRVEVNKSGVWMELQAKTGKACCKFACDRSKNWVNERQPIEEVYQFSAWVQGFTTTLLPANNN